MGVVLSNVISSSKWISRIQGIKFSHEYLTLKNQCLKMREEWVWVIYAKVEQLPYALVMQLAILATFLSLTAEENWKDALIISTSESLYFPLCWLAACGRSVRSVPIQMHRKQLACPFHLFLSCLQLLHSSTFWLSFQYLTAIPKSGHVLFGK